MGTLLNRESRMWVHCRSMPCCRRARQWHQQNWIMQTLARKNLFTNSPCCVSFILSLTVPPRLCFQMFPILEILTSSLASWHLDKQAIHSGVVSAGEAVSCIPLVGAASSTCNDGDGHVINCHHFKMICQVFLCALPLCPSFIYFSHGNKPLQHQLTFERP